MSAESIAAADTLSAGTVRWRLARGRELLRAALVRRDGRAWSSWAVALAPLASAPPAAVSTITAITTGAVMTVKGTLIGAALGALAASASWALRPAGDTTDPASIAYDANTAPSSPPSDGALLDVPASTVGKKREAATLAASAVPDPLFGIVAHGRVVDERGGGISRARLRLEDEAGILTDATCDDSGGWSSLGLAPGAHALEVAAEGHLTRQTTVDVPTAQVWRYDVVLRAAPSFPVRFEDPTGAPLPDSSRSPAHDLGVAALRSSPGARLPSVAPAIYFSEAARYRSRAHGYASPTLDERYDGVLELTTPPPLWVAAAYRDVVLESRLIDGRERELVFVIDPARFTELAGTVRVRIVDRDLGESVLQGAELAHASGGMTSASKTRQTTLEFVGVPPGTQDLLFSLAPFERIERSVDVVAGGVVDLGVLQVGRSRAFEVRVVDEAGAPRAIPATAVRPELCAGPGDLDLRISGLPPTADGVTRVTWLAPGDVLVRAGGRDGLARVARRVDTARETRVELVVPVGIEVFVKAQETAVGRVHVLYDAAGEVLYGGATVPERCFLAPGAYALARLDEGRESARRAFTVGDSRTVVRIGDR
jgi:hypothetical protein